MGKGNQGRFNNDDAQGVNNKAQGVNNKAQFGVAPVPYHIHSGSDSPIICQVNNIVTDPDPHSATFSIGGFTVYAGNQIEFGVPSVLNGAFKIIPNGVVIEKLVYNASAPGTNTTIGASNTPTLIPLATPAFIQNVTYVTGGGFKIITAGQYIVTGVAYFGNPGAATVRTMVYVNGAAVLTSYETLSGSGIISNKNVTGILNLHVGDNVQLYGETSSGSTATVTGANSYLSLAMV